MQIKILQNNNNNNYNSGSIVHDPRSVKIFVFEGQAPSTVRRRLLKTAATVHTKKSFSKTLLKPEGFENAGLVFYRERITF